MHDEQYHVDTGRIEAFSDGVFAIAITLLVLEVRVPHVEEGGSLAMALRDIWPSYVAYAVSFISIGIMWANHHNMFKDIARFDHSVVVLNLLLLMGISFLPFPTALVAEYVREGHHEKEAVLVYTTAMAFVAFMFGALWLYISRHGELLDEHVSPTRIRSRTRRYLPGTPLYGACVLLTLVNYWIPLVVIAGLAAFYLLPVADE
jgi:uncharacterized membrane protein